MTKRDFFRLLIKLLGLYLTVGTLFSTIPSYISYSIVGLNAAGFLTILGSMLIIIALFTFLIFKADTVINWLKLDEGFDDNSILTERMNSESLLKIGLIIIGGLLVIDNLPSFLSNTLFALKSDIDGIDLGLKDNFNWVVNAANIVIGYLLITNYNLVTKFVKDKAEENTSNDK